MEVGETERKKLQEQVPWVPTTPLKPILPRPVPIWTPGEGNQLCFRSSGISACFESSAGVEINNGSHHRSEPAAFAHDNSKTRVQISFDDISSSSNGISELLSQADTPSAYSNATHDGFLNQFVPTFNSRFNPTYKLLSHHHHPSPEQPFVNTIHDNYQDLQGASYFAYCSEAFPQVAPPPDNAITAELRQDETAQMTMEERDQEGEEKNVRATKCNNSHSKLYDPVMEVAAVSTPHKENHNYKKEISHDFDLNKTPQSKPRRRKHRPKVITEGKPKRTGKQVTTKPVQSKENSTDKRKARRKGLNTTPQREVTGEWTKPLMPESAKKTCRRSLNFDIGEPRDNSACRENATTHFGRDISVVVEETQALNNCAPLREDTQAPITYLSKCNSPVAKPNPNYIEIGSSRGWMIAQDGHKNSANILSKSVAQSSPNDSNSSKSKILSTGSGSHVVGSKRKQSGIEQADNSSINLIGAHYNAVQAYYQKYLVQFPNVHKKRRSEKGRISNTSYTSSMTATKDVQLSTCPQDDARSHSYASSPNCWTSASEYNAAGVPAIITATERAIHDKPQSFEYNLSLGQRRPTKRRSRVPTRIHDCALLTITRNCDTKLALTAKQTCSSDRQTFGDAERPQTCIDALVAEMRASLTKKKRTRKRSIPVSSAYSCTNEMQQRHKVVLENHSIPSHNSSDVASEEIWKNIHTVDVLTEQFRCLNIYREARELVLHGQNMLVPYNQQNQKNKGLVHEYGTMIPFEGPFDPIKKQRPRPKVDLDEETNRVWKLLLLDINSHGIDGTDEDKAKWWEEERNVFRGRADSFIARMHLVQGDRRFSQWKGSVVDSVIGVFLTQNVSDHLSSSAFMSLAARFPLRSSSKYKTCHRESTSLIVNEPQVCIVEPEEIENLDEKILDQSVCELNSLTIDIIGHSEEREAVDSNDSCRTNSSLIVVTDESDSKLLESAQRHNSEHSPVESGAISAMTGEGQENLCRGSVRIELNDVFSSQCSAVTSQISGDFSIDQNPEKIGSFSDSNSEIEDLSSAAKYNIYYNRTSFSELLEMASSTILHEVSSQRSKSTENLSDTCGQSIDMKHDNQLENLEKSNVTQGSLEASIINEYTLKITPNSGVLEVNCYDPLNIEVPSSGSSKDKDENDKRSTFPTESDNQAAIVHSQGQTQDPMQKARELDFGDHNYAMRNENTKIDSAPAKLRSRERGKEKKNNFDWDSLRIQAQAKAGKREKTENTMDSLDWDAVRRADVNEIADTIKERGMNNMLAERIKNFLNLLVDMHGGIDLEWLRDVPPDRAKEYLLSIRGLGLKSVECVRLLTLHHLAFPVDTNVGRIAVRLGWVPLQPLPESLQLHLLELYPVLESIQKYLWPRLCKLDQRTLYELHYQLITFGKVFCTKSKPNCNACPMRGECRHFASAFASARLALPGPEQKSIVITTGNNATEQHPSLIINQLPLLLPENTNQAELQQTEVIRQLEAKSEINISQPIIEEPATPEPECSQVSENDIEDTLNEESCEIPTIKLDIEEFTLNLQNYIQENMELQEGEMSKALVALHPDAACIPTPKLKNVSRLRTEHYVYELPDSHPLLNGWDKREPDDPGKYLLAIWTPGETADSIQLPERKCSSQDFGQLCNEKECFSCNSFREANSQIVRGTLLIPCRTAMRGSFPLNGTYFQVNEVFADNDSSLNPISVPRSWIWNLDRRTVYFGTSIPSIFKGLSTREIQQCFWRGKIFLPGCNPAYCNWIS
ncbi:ROS1 protein [Spatholobus suberectus]|nr:ROS1 protein [Spatholobus suberectus]